jgi:hypothetical protein
MGEPGTIGAGDEVPSQRDAGAAGAVGSVTAVEIDPDNTIQEEVSRKSRWNRRIALIGGLVVLIAAAVVLPPLVNISRYQRRITALMTRSMGRPVHMSNVELRLLPRPGFVLHDLSVSEDPGFGAEPILSARTVVASIRILSLWRGRLAIDRVSVDEASLNLVRSAQGRWNLDSLLMGARPALTGDAGGSSSQGPQAPGAFAHFPYLEATDSRVNLKNGIEKSPFSLVGADLSLWQDEPGSWRVRLRGQPVRTDMEMSSADTGEVRMEASLRSAAQLREMPLQLQMEWRDAQLGQLSRLLSGSDAGWRGDVTADIEVKGTPDSAQTKARLRAVGVRREEFAPGTPLDFDANCNFLYRHSQNAFHNLGCDTAIGGGQLHLKAELPGNGGNPEANLEVNQVPLQAGLDLLRTVRSGFAPGISVKGAANGSLTYKEIAAGDQETNKPLRHTSTRQSARKTARTESIAVPTNLQGSLTVDGAQLQGGGLKEALVLPKITLTPALVPSSAPTAEDSPSSVLLSARFSILQAPVAPSAASTATSQSSPQSSPQPGSLSGSQPSPQPAAAPAQTLTVRLGLGVRGYDATVTGSTSTARLRDLVYAFGLPHLDAADGLSGGTADVDLTATGPWIPLSDAAASSPPVLSPAATDSSADAALEKKPESKASALASAASASPKSPSPQDSFSGSMQLRHAQWKAAYLARPVDLTQTAITISGPTVAFNSDFSYGGPKSPGKDLSKDAAKVPIVEPIKGSVAVHASAICKPAGPGDQSSPGSPSASACEPQVELRFGALDAAALQAALVGAPEQKSLFAPLMDRMRSSDRPKLPEVTVHVQADSLMLGAALLQRPVIRMQFKPSEVILEDIQTDLLGGSAKLTGHFAWTGAKPEYTFEGSFSRLNAAAVGELVNAQWTGGPISGSGSIQLSGLTAKDLQTSAVGNLRFDWLHGVLSRASMAATASPEARATETKPETKFDDWNGTVSIQAGKAQLGKNGLILGKRNSVMAGAIPFGGPVKLSVVPTETKLVAHTTQPASQPAQK